MKISTDVISSFKPAKIFHENENVINSMDFTADGNLLITASDDESMTIYNTETGTQERRIFSKKYGVDLIRFTHHSNSVICASKNKWDETIRYLSLYDNRYLRYFKGHRDRVVSLTMCPINDTFVSGSLDGTVRLWDLRSVDCQGLLRMNHNNVGFIGHSVATSFDPEGMILAVSLGGNAIKLYDTRSYDTGPFKTFIIEHEKPFYWYNMKFSNDGKLVLLTTQDGIIVVDSFEGRLIQHIPLRLDYPLEACFSPDGQFVLCGTMDGLVNVWNSVSGKLVAVWRGEVPHPAPVGRVLFNPKKMMAVSACSQVAFWLPAI